jgi:hypothetical protein
VCGLQDGHAGEEPDQAQLGILREALKEMAAKWDGWAKCEPFNSPEWEAYKRCSADLSTLISSSSVLRDEIP